MPFPTTLNRLTTTSLITAIGTLITAAILLVPNDALAGPSLGQLKQSLPRLDIAEIEPSAVPGIWELLDRNGQIYYVTEDGEHLFAGELLEVRSQRSLTETRRMGLRAKLLATAPADLLQFSAAQAEHEVTVVTDIDCGYCRRLHQQIGDYNASGISVNYLMMPRAGLGSPSHQKAVNAVCSSDPVAAFTAAMNGAEPDKTDCVNTVADQFSLARKLGVTGTPSIISHDGKMIAGYVPPQELLKRLSK